MSERWCWASGWTGSWTLTWWESVDSAERETERKRQYVCVCIYMREERERMCGSVCAQVREWNLFPEFSSDVTKPLDAVEAHGLQPAVSQHLYHLSVLWNTSKRFKIMKEFFHTSAFSDLKNKYTLNLTFIIGSTSGALLHLHLWRVTWQGFSLFPFLLLKLSC